MLKKIKILSGKGFFHILGSSVINKIIQFCSGIFLVRIFTKLEFGIYSYAQNILSLFLLISGLGVTSGLLQFGSEGNKIEKIRYFKYATKIGIGSNIIISLLMLIISIYIPMKLEGSAEILILMSGIPIFIIIFNLIQTYNRIFLKNKEFSYITSFNSLLMLIFLILGGYYFNVKGVVLGIYLAYTITIIFGIKYSKIFLRRIIKSRELTKIKKKDFSKYSFICVSCNSISGILYLIDIFMIGIIISESNVLASYKGATLIPFALNFIPSSVITFIFPYFVKNRRNKKWIREKSKLLIISLGCFNLIVSIILIVFAPLIIRIFLGSEYLDAIKIFRILICSYFLTGTFRIPMGNILNTLKKVKVNLYISIFSGVLNIILDIFLIKSMGSLGAAISTVSIVIVTSIMNLIFLVKSINEINTGNNKTELIS